MDAEKELYARDHARIRDMVLSLEQSINEMESLFESLRHEANVQHGKFPAKERELHETAPRLSYAEKSFRVAR